MKINVKKGMYGFSTKLKGNTVDGEAIYDYLNVKFAKCNEPDDTLLRIDVKDCFLTCYEGKDGVKPKLIITDYDVIEVYNNNIEQAEYDNNDSDLSLDEFDGLDLPFD